MDYCEKKDVNSEKSYREIPIINISLMSDEHWNELVKEQQAGNGKFSRKKPMNN